MPLHTGGGEPAPGCSWGLLPGEPKLPPGWRPGATRHAGLPPQHAARRAASYRRQRWDCRRVWSAWKDGTDGVNTRSHLTAPPPGAQHAHCLCRAPGGAVGHHRDPRLQPQTSTPLHLGDRESCTQCVGSHHRLRPGLSPAGAGEVQHREGHCVVHQEGGAPTPWSQALIACPPLPAHAPPSCRSSTRSSAPRGTALWAATSGRL